MGRKGPKGNYIRSLQTKWLGEVRKRGGGEMTAEGRKSASGRQGNARWRGEVVSARSEARSGAVQESAGVGVCRVRRKGWARGNKKGHSGAEERPGKAGKSGGMNSGNYPGFRHHAEVETVRGA